METRKCYKCHTLPDTRTTRTDRCEGRNSYVASYRMKCDRCQSIGSFQSLLVRLEIYVILGDWDRCYGILTEFTNDREPYFKTCSSKDDTCPNAGMKMPPIPMQNSEFYGFSEFWYSMEEVLGMGKTHFYLIVD